MPSSPPDQVDREADRYSAAMGATEDIDLYLAGLPVEQRDAMSMLRRIIAEAVPEAEETISYGMPAFRYRRRPLVVSIVMARVAEMGGG